MTRRKGQHYSLGFKEQVMERLLVGEKVRLLAWELKVPKSLLYEWREQAELRPGGKKYEREKVERDEEVQMLEARIGDLEGVVGRQTLELDFFRGALRRLGKEVPSSERAGKKPSVPRSAGGWNRKANSL